MNLATKPSKPNAGHGKRILAVAYPVIIQGLLIHVQTLINRAFLGHSRVEYLSAVGNAVFPFYTTVSIVMAASVGLTILVAQSLGARRYEAARQYVYAGMCYGTLFSLALFALWFCLPAAIFSATGVGPELIDYCVDYVRIISFSLIFLGIEASTVATLQGAGITRPILYASLSRIVLNIALDWVLIFGHLGAPAMGLQGAALATAVSTIASTLYMLACLATARELPFRLRARELMAGASFERFKHILQIGLPTGAETLIWYVGTLFIIRILNGLDSLAVGIYTLIYGIDIAVFAIYNGLARASLTLVGNKIGQDNRGEARAILTTALGYTFMLVSTLCLLFLAFPRQILAIFTDDPGTIDRSAVFFMLMAVTLFPKSTNVVAGSGIRGCGDTKWMLYTQCFGTSFVCLSAYVMVSVFKVGIAGLYITILLDETIRAIVNTRHLYLANLRLRSEVSGPQLEFEG